MTAINKDNLSKPPEYASSRFHMSFDRSYLSAEARKTAYTSWLLCKGFQELARSIRQMLEEAFFYNSMIEFAERESCNYPPAEPGALGCEPLEAAGWGR
jgi:hypothetical protein